MPISIVHRSGARSSVAGALLTASLFHVGLVGAHAPPEATGVYWANTGRVERAVVRTNRGLIFQEPENQAFSLLCGEAFQSTVSETAPVALVSDGTVVVGSYQGGLRASSPDHCNFAPPTNELAGLYAVDIQASPHALDELFVLTLPLDGGPSVLLTRPNARATWQTLTTLDGAPDSLRVSAADGERVYVVSMRSEGTQQIADILRSSDRGKSFAVTPLALQAQEVRAYLLEAGQSDPDQFFLRTQTADGIAPERLLSSDDGGLTVREVLKARGPLAFVSSPDGKTWWLGGFDGLFRSLDAGHSFQAVLGAPERIGCLAWHDNRLYVCGYSDAEFGVLSSSDPGQRPFDWFLRFPQVHSRVKCPADTNEGLACEYPFEDWSREQSAVESAAPVAAMTDRGSGSPPPGRESNAKTPTTTDTRGCSVGASSADEVGRAWVALLLLCATGWWRRARRARVMFHAGGSRR